MPTHPLSQKLLRWFDKNQRPMPWRAVKGGVPNPYYVAVSEFMLQQTTVATVIPYFQKFIKRWPRFAKLATAKIEDVRAAWSGLGYYRRAQLLHQLAQDVMRDHKGVLPRTSAELIRLSGLGLYSAAAIAAIAFNEKIAVVDGNVERVAARLFMLSETGLPLRETVRGHIQKCVPAKRSGDFAQAVMELGALVCRPKTPACGECPLRTLCKAYQQQQQENFPVKKTKAKIPTRYGVVYVLRDKNGRFLMRKRPDNVLLGGMWEFPSTNWADKSATKPPRKTALQAALKETGIDPNNAWQKHKTPVIHVFSHFRLQLSLQLGHSKTIFKSKTSEYRWIAVKDLERIPLPTVMRKIVDAVGNA